jgi:hypothetical protein
MHRVYKYQLELQPLVTIKMPRGAELLYLNIQHEVPCIWARVKIDNPTEDRTFRICGTGHDAEDTGPYVGSFYLQGGLFVFHVFGVKP